MPGLASKVSTSAVGSANGVASLDATAKVPVAQLPSSLEPDATTSSKGIVQLAGDLGGTAASPTVPGLSAKADDTAVVHKASNETITGVKVFSSSPEVPDPSSGTEAANKQYVDGAITAGGSPDATTTTKGIVQLAGDLAGTAASPTVPGLGNKADTSTTVTGANSISGGGDLSTNRTLSLVNDSATPGNSMYYGTDGTGSKGFHSIPVDDPAMGGDLSGTASNAQIVADAVGTTELADSAVTSAKIADGTIIDDDISGTAAIAQSKISGLTTALSNKVDTSSVGANSGVASLDSGGKVPSSQLPIIYQPQAYSYGGTISVTTGAHRLYNDTGSAWTIASVRASLGTAPTGSSAIFDVNVDGTTVFTTQSNRPTIAASGYTSGKVTNMDVTTVADGSYVTVDIDQIGSTVAGADLTVQVEVY